MPFEWGTNDCGLFVADAVKAVAGIDLAAQCRGRYDSKASATALLLAECGGDLETYAVQQTAMHGFQEVGVKLAQRGDMLLLVQGANKTLGIVSLDGMKALLMHEEEGLIRVPIINQKTKEVTFSRAWRVS